MPSQRHQAILRVIDVSELIDDMLARYFYPLKEFPMAGSPRAQDYFVLYTKIKVFTQANLQADLQPDSQADLIKDWVKRLERLPER
jgi:hypothetical protein